MDKDFRKYLVKGLGLSGNSVDSYGMMMNNIINPTIIEERQLNVAQMDVFSRLMMDRIIFIGTEINRYTASVIQAQLLYLSSVDESKDISLYLNTPGGSVYDGLGIYDTMQYIKCDVSTVCMGMAASMGSILLSAGTKGKRYALPHSRVMIHQPMGGTGDMTQCSDIQITAKEIQKCKDELFHILSDNTGQSFKKIVADGDRDFWMTADEALKYGIIDEIFNNNKK